MRQKRRQEHTMNPALTNIQNNVRAAELRERAERHGSPVLTRRSSRRAAAAATELEKLPVPSHAAAFGALFVGHGFFGREHGSHA
jgi:hypothetical protein